MGMTPEQVKAKALQLVAKYVEQHLDPTDNIDIRDIEVYIVFSAYILQHYKAMISTSLPDGMYYEVTYNPETCEFYLVAYKRVEQVNSFGND